MGEVELFHKAARTSLAHFWHAADESVQSSSVLLHPASMQPGNFNQMNESQVPDFFDFGA
jgi:hypothetical protein